MMSSHHDAYTSMIDNIHLNKKVSNELVRSHNLGRNTSSVSGQMWTMRRHNVPAILSYTQILWISFSLLSSFIICGSFQPINRQLNLQRRCPCFTSPAPNKFSNFYEPYSSQISFSNSIRKKAHTIHSNLRMATTEEAVIIGGGPVGTSSTIAAHTSTYCPITIDSLTKLIVLMNQV